MANIKTYSKAKNGAAKLSDNFSVREFACKDGSDTVYIDLDLVAILQKIRDHFGKSVTINSAYRTPVHNKKEGGSTTSYHLKGQAADIRVSGVSTAEVAKCAESLGAKGVMQYITKNFVHVDTRPSKYFAKVVNGVTSAVSTFGGSAPSGSRATVRKGSKGGDVTYLQTALNAKGYSCGAADGVFGAKTEAAVIAYQKANGLTADGIVGPKTYAKLAA